MKRITATSLLFAIVSIVFSPAPVLADGQVQFDGPFQRATNGSDIPFVDNIYERYDYPAIFGYLFLYFDPQNLPNDGDVWEVRLRDVVTPSRSASYILTYDGATDCLTNNLGGQACDITNWFENPFDFTYFNLPIGFGTQCIAESTWAWAVEYNVQNLPGFPYTILPEDFSPGNPLMLFSGTSMQPEVPPSADPGFPDSVDPGLTPGSIDVLIAVQDDLGCGLYLDDELLRVSTEILPQTNSHKHFAQEGQPGTGTFALIDPPSPPGEIGAPDVEFRMDGHPSHVTYTAGKYALRENLKVQVLEAELERTASQELDITVAAAGFNLLPLDLDSEHFAVTGTYTSSCDVQHNDGDTERRSHYLDTTSLYRASVMAAHFHTLTGLKLSYNDASLPEGGFFDNGAANRDAKCHFTHRLGIDVDVNGQPVNPSACLEGTGPKLSSCEVFFGTYPEAVIALDKLDDLAEITYQAHWWRERPLIHYRFPR